MSKHLKRIKRAEKKTASALKAFVRAEQKLQKENVNIELLLDDIDHDMNQLADARAEAKLHQEVNSGMIKRLGEFVRGS